MLIFWTILCGLSAVALVVILIMRAVESHRECKWWRAARKRWDHEQ